ncbi:MAG: DUF4230 domain-containing protein [Akkermansiaceae bacterium]
MSFIRLILPLTLIAVLAVCGLWVKKNFIDEQNSTVVSMAPTVEEIETLSELVTNRVYVSDILKGSNKDYEGLWAINGDALITIDLSQATISDKDEEAKTASITLPMPKVVSARVDHERTLHGGIKGVRFALLRNPKNRAKIVDDAMQEAQAVVEKAANRPEIIENAQKQAKLNIQMLYLKVGWNVSVKWQKATDLPK